MAELENIKQIINKAAIQAVMAVMMATGDTEVGILANH